MMTSVRDQRQRSHPGARAPNDSITIGLINNMPDAALRSTELQFRAVLASAAQNLSIDLRLYMLPERPRSEASRARLVQGYEDLSDLWPSSVDGLIVTGAEPQALSLQQEPYWHTLTKIIEWAGDHTASTIWSCLAAHAAVLYLDGVERRPLDKKLFGVFKCVKTMNHNFVAGLPTNWYTPHSRYNELPEVALASCGYEILSRSRLAGADMFVKHQRRSLFLFVQGHPEYDAEALFREYRRDVKRFLVGKRDCYPELPRGCFQEQTAAALSALRRRARQRRDVVLLSSFPALPQANPIPVWRLPAISIYASWLSYLAEQKSGKPWLTSPSEAHG
jgi:homoserine O-succinyltransferase/O-acetyltransferase